MPDAPPALLKGTLDMLILQVVRSGPIHGYGVARRIGELSAGDVLVEEGSLYPALHRLVKRGLLKSTWGLSSNNRQARFYELTARGRKKLELDVAAWRRISAAISRVLDAPAPKPERRGDERFA